MHGSERPDHVVLIQFEFLIYFPMPAFGWRRGVYWCRCPKAVDLYTLRQLEPLCTNPHECPLANPDAPNGDEMEQQRLIARAVLFNAGQPAGRQE